MFAAVTQGVQDHVNTSSLIDPTEAASVNANHDHPAAETEDHAPNLQVALPSSPGPPMDTSMDSGSSTKSLDDEDPYARNTTWTYHFNSRRAESIHAYMKTLTRSRLRGRILTQQSQIEELQGEISDLKDKIRDFQDIMQGNRERIAQLECLLRLEFTTIIRLVGLFNTSPRIQ
ncbi:hypothetical protein FA15DRAFT_661143 [Coprinopsis marcescibilis]|uniref:Uncharacterized protein n=1 Tax=Coprinopsis marcescibilis TaxID=230819 RepID=A0A5C3KCS1_COPMA|nr:hypothetical protein FA15DRAFT_661143 [Coprinopsis marcescibilis]